MSSTPGATGWQVFGEVVCVAAAYLGWEPLSKLLGTLASFERLLFSACDVRRVHVKVTCGSLGGALTRKRSHSKTIENERTYVILFGVGE